ncbi:MAG: pyridoxal 5'-phosphate synthase glutaminase subunit PdxT [Oligoflexia bacterium]|nr:pyridoxal 5'-phosphate synthase glutaminase subunit PdxT [Oligoflexia bacterium]
MSPSVGVLALQGAVDPHLEMLDRLNVQGRKVKRPSDLDGLTHIILPGGESTTMLRLLALSGLDAALKVFAKHSAVWGICAGAILIAQEVVHPAQRSLALINMRAHRNHYGCQLDSFKQLLQIEGLAQPVEADFIRAPLLEALSDKVQVLARRGDESVLLRQGRILASSFHVELGVKTDLHRYFLSI